VFEFDDLAYEEVPFEFILTFYAYEISTADWLESEYYELECYGFSYEEV